MGKIWYTGVIMPDKPYINRPPRINQPQLPLFIEHYPSRDCFISGDERHPDEGRVYIPWDNIAAKVVRDQIEFLQGE